MILDESQSIKTPSSQRAFAVKQLKSENRFVMTGTPIENNTLELWSQMDFINEGILGTAHQFKEHFGGVLDSVTDKEKAKSLKKLIHPFILRRVKSQVAKELPTKTEMILQCEMGSEQRMVYDTYRKEIRKKMATKIEENGLGRVKFSILPELLRLRQLCNGTSLIKGKEDFGDYSVKSDLLIEHILDKHQNHKILVFTQFLGMMDLITY